MERFFKLKERGTTVKTEFIAGMTTFFCDGLYSNGKRKYVFRPIR